MTRLIFFQVLIFCLVFCKAQPNSQVKIPTQYDEVMENRAEETRKLNEAVKLSPRVFSKGIQNLKPVLLAPRPADFGDLVGARFWEGGREKVAVRGHDGGYYIILGFMLDFLIKEVCWGLPYKDYEYSQCSKRYFLLYVSTALCQGGTEATVHFTDSADNITTDCDGIPLIHTEFCPPPIPTPSQTKPNPIP